jgi:signal transduction histidine kinase
VFCFHSISTARGTEVGPAWTDGREAASLACIARRSDAPIVDALPSLLQERAVVVATRRRSEVSGAQPVQRSVAAPATFQATAEDAIVRAYRTEVCEAIARRLPALWALFYLLNSIASAFEWHYFPARRDALLVGQILYVVLGLVAVLVVRARPRLTVATVVVANNVLTLVACGYYEQFDGNAEILASSLALFLTGFVVMLPWGIWPHLWSSVGAVAGYPVAVALGATPTMPIGYGMLFLVSALVLTSVGAALLDRHRFAAYRAALEARRADAAKSEFLSTVSHELRTPLNVILGYTGILLENDEDSVTRQQMLRRVHEESCELLDLIQAMLAVNRLSAGELAITVEEFSLVDVLDHLRATLPESWRKDAVVLEWQVADGLPRMSSDRRKVTIVARNLLHNALKFTQHGRVTVRVGRMPEAGRVELSVEDTGPGIAASELSQIFGKFQQGTVPGPGGGVGLGLYIVRRFTDALGGAVHVRSAPGAGACFTVSLPIAISPAA